MPSAYLLSKVVCSGKSRSFDGQDRRIVTVAPFLDQLMLMSYLRIARSARDNKKAFFGEPWGSSDQSVLRAPFKEGVERVS